MSRDPLCDYQVHFDKRRPCPICELFAKARADEREKAAQRMCDAWNAGPDLFSRLIDAVRGES